MLGKRSVDSPSGVKLGNRKVESHTRSFGSKASAAADEARWGRGGGSLTSLTPWGLTAFDDVVPTALGPLAEVRGGDDQIQRGAGGLPRAQQRANPAAA